MMDLLRWDGWPTSGEWQAFGAIATAVIALVAAIIALRQYKTAVRNQIEQARPFVNVDFYFLGSLIACVEVKNTGHTAAHEITFTWDKKPIAEDERSQTAIDRALVDGSIPFLAPGRTLLYLLNRYDDDEQSDLPRRYEVTARYRGHENTIWESKSVLDVDQWAMTLVERDPYESITRELKKLAEAARNQKDAEQNLAKAADSINVFLENSPRVIDARARYQAELEKRWQQQEARMAKLKSKMETQASDDNPAQPA